MCEFYSNFLKFSCILQPPVSNAPRRYQSTWSNLVHSPKQTKTSSLIDIRDAIRGNLSKSIFGLPGSDHGAPSQKTPSAEGFRFDFKATLPLHASTPRPLRESGSPTNNSRATDQFAFSQQSDRQQGPSEGSSPTLRVALKNPKYFQGVCCL